MPKDQPSIKDDKLSEEQRERGVGKERAARIANAKAGGTDVSEKGGEADSYEDRSVNELQERRERSASKTLGHRRSARSPICRRALAASSASRRRVDAAAVARPATRSRTANRQQLYVIARDRDIPGRSKMGEWQLIDAIRKSR
ncbi:MAG: hypothetical protein H0V79_09455 [Actinobacteria bacterium]|nr:hypothetical protein [Actinomycetota bacterium]